MSRHGAPRYDRKEKSINVTIVAEKIDKLFMRKFPQIVRAESARFIVPVYSSVSSQPPYEIHLLVNTVLVLFSRSSTTLWVGVKGTVA